MLERTAQEWVDLLQEHGIPCGRIRSVGEVCEDPQTKARDMVVSLNHPKAGPIRVTGVPIKLSETPGEVKTPPPVLGQHTGEVLADWLKLSAPEIEALAAAGAF